MSNVKLQLKQCSESAMELDNDQLKIIIDRPVEKGGGGLGIMGGQYLLTGIAGCFCSNLFAAAQSRDIEIKGLKIDISATISDDLPKRFSKVDLNVLYEFCSDKKSFTKLLTIAKNGCISINTVKDSVTVNIVEV